MIKIMIVEDMIVIQEILKEIFNLKGYSVIYTASDGQEAIDYFLNPNNTYPDLIIMDHRMPNKDGLTALKEILEISSEIKIVFVSADESARNEALKKGAISYLVKPISIKDILTLIDELVIS
ncbi:MAG TPA: response regulator [candidate division Zixibacteria bacterium]|nr:response regulator [candidate division Zixibacteria bacterium]